MSVDPAAPITRPESLPTADQDLDPDAKDDEDFQDNLQNDPDRSRPEDWNEPPASAPVVPANQPSPLSDDQR